METKKLKIAIQRRRACVRQTERKREEEAKAHVAPDFTFEGG